MSEWSKSDNNISRNVRLEFNKHWRPGITVSSLIIQKVNSSHNGVFQCIPSNSDPKEIKVHVLKGIIICLIINYLLITIQQKFMRP